MRWINLSIELRKLKYKVFVLTFGDENKIFEDNGIVIIQRKIIRPFNFLYRSKNKNLSKGVIDSSQNLFLKFLSWCRVNLFYPDARFLQYNNLIQFLTKFINENNINTIISSSPPHSIHKIVLKLKKTRKFKWILDFRDPYLNWDILLSMNPTFISKWIHSSFQKYFTLNFFFALVKPMALQKGVSPQRTNGPLGRPLAELGVGAHSMYSMYSCTQCTHVLNVLFVLAAGARRAALEGRRAAGRRP